MNVRVLAIVATLGMLMACAPRAPAIAPTAVTPSVGPSDAEAALRVEGTFPMWHTADFVDPTGSTSSTFSVSIGGVRVSGLLPELDGSLQLQLPAGVEPGVHDVLIQSSDGRRATLPGAYTTRSTSAELVILPVTDQHEDVAFPVTVRILDRIGRLASDLGGPLELEELTGSLSPTHVQLDGGEWSGELTVTSPLSADVLTAAFSGISARSNLFAVRRKAAPRALFVHSPAVIAPGGTVSFDATRSSDPQSSPEQLELSWSFEDSGVDLAEAPPAAPWTPFSTSRTAAHTYSSEGLFYARLAVRDLEGDVGYSQRVLVRVTPEAPCVVNTLSSSDDGATGCDGWLGFDERLSLPEALRISNATAGTQRITFDLSLLPPETEARVECGGCLQDTLTISDSVEIHGVNHRGRDVRVDGWDWSFTGGSSLVSGVRISSDSGSYRRVTVGAGAAVRFVRSSFRDFEDLNVQGRVELEDSSLRRCNATCIFLDGAEATLRLRGGELAVGTTNPTFTTHGITARNCGAGTTPVIDALGVAFVALGETAVMVESSCARPTVLMNNTFHGNDTAVQLSTGDGHVLVSNIITDSAIRAADCGSAAFSERGRNLLSGNASAGCLADDPGNLFEPPRYLDASFVAPDLRLLPGSPAVDAAEDRGEDFNGTGPGRYFGSAPDLGGRESW